MFTVSRLLFKWLNRRSQRRSVNWARFAPCIASQSSGQMTSLIERSQVITLVAEAIVAGARQDRACAAITLSKRALQRWQRDQLRRVCAVRRCGLAVDFECDPIDLARPELF